MTSDASPWACRVDLGADSGGLTRRLPLVGGSDPLLTIRPLWQGPLDAQMRFAGDRVARAMRLPTGAATLLLEAGRGEVQARAWGQGAAEALERVAALVGERDDPSPLVAQHAIVSALQRRLPGLRLTSGTPLLDTLLIAIVGQKVTTYEAQRSLRSLIRRHGAPAPGPLELWLPPPPEKLARLPYWAFHASGIERRRADLIRAAAAVADRLATFGDLPPGENRRG